MIQNREYTLIIDKSGSLIKVDHSGGKSRWKQMQESTLALAGKCDTIDPNGITVYLFSGRFKRYDHTKMENMTLSEVLLYAIVD